MIDRQDRYVRAVRQLPTKGVVGAGVAKGKAAAVKEEQETLRIGAGFGLMEPGSEGTDRTGNLEFGHLGEGACLAITLAQDRPECPATGFETLRPDAVASDAEE